MDYEAAVNVILMHGIGREDVPPDAALYRNGFVGSLRPYAGLREANFVQVMDAIIALHPHLTGTTHLDRRLVEGLWGLTRYARWWGLDAGSMLVRNRLISAEDAARLLGWVQCIESAVARLLRGDDPAAALATYRGEPDVDAWPS